MELEEKIQICKLVAQAIIADTRITDSEREFLNKLMDSYRLDDRQKKDVMARNLNDDPGEMAKTITSFESKSELLKELVMAAASDGEINKAERQVLKRVAEVLGITEADLDLLTKAATS